MREYGSEFNYTGKDNSIQNIWKNFKSFHLLRCGRDAVLATAKVLKNRSIKKVLVPALSCSSMYDGFVNEGLQVEFYAIDEHFNPRLDSSISYKNVAILFMLYYGVTDNSLIEEFIRPHKDCITIVDITHSVWNEETYKISADFLIGSIRKTVGVINGGIFLSNDYNISPYKKSNKFTEYRKSAFKIKNEYNTSLDGELKDKYRKLFFEAENSLSLDKEVYLADDESIEFISSLNINDLQAKRISNYKYLSVLLKKKGIKPLCGQLYKGSVPFSLPIIVENQLLVQKKLASYGIYAPVLWPINKKAEEACDFSKSVSYGMLSLPIDQRYSLDDMAEIFERLVCVLYEK